MRKQTPIHNARKIGPATTALRAAAEFSNADLSDEQGVRQWSRVIYDRFLDLGGAGQFLAFDAKSGARMAAAQVTQGDLVEMQTDTRNLFSTIVAVRTGRSGQTIKPHSVMLQNLEFLVLPVGRRVMLLINGSVPDIFRHTLVRALENGDTERIRQCPDPHCARFFYKTGKKDYCSTRCQSRVYMRKRRQEEKGARRDRRTGKSAPQKG